MMDFKSKGRGVVSQEILQSILEANSSSRDYQLDLNNKFSELFQKDVVAYLVSSQAAANSLALSSLVKYHNNIYYCNGKPAAQNVYCGDACPIDTSTCCAPSIFSGGGDVIFLPSLNGKTDLALLEASIVQSLSTPRDAESPGCISLAQSTESGEVYTPQEMRLIKQTVEKYKISMHVDGTNFANALVALGCTPAEITWKVGVDVLSFGATENGALCAEAVIFFNQDYHESFLSRNIYSRAGQGFYKSKFFACQFLAYFNDDLWLKNASNANLMCKKLEEVFLKNNFKVVSPVKTNVIFVHMPEGMPERLLEKGCEFYPSSWGQQNDSICRFVTSFLTTQEDIDSFSQLLSSVLQV